MENLKTIQVNAKRSIDSFLKLITSVSSSHEIQVGCYGLGVSYRDLAISSFLLDGDIFEFRKNCFLAGRCRSYFLIKMFLGMPAGDEFIASTFDDHLYNCLAGCDDQMIPMIPLWTSDYFDSNIDDKEYYCFSMFIRCLMMNFPNNMKTFLNRIRKLNPNGFYAIIAEGFFEKDCKLFEDGLEKFLESYELKIDNNKIDNESEKYLSVTGVALACLANRYGMDINFDHVLVPKVLTGYKETVLEIREGYPKLTDKENEGLSKLIDSQLESYTS